MKKKPVVYAFIDSQNLNMGVKSLGWKLDYRKFRQYLRSKYGVEQAFLFIGLIPANAAMYVRLQKMGYILVFKPTMELPDGAVKGNVDAELVLHAMIQLPEYDKAIIVSGDGDFHCLVEYLEEKGKLLHVLAPNKHFSGLLRKFWKYTLLVSNLRGSLELTGVKKAKKSKPGIKKSRTSGRPRP